MITVNLKANQVLNEAREEYLQAMKKTQRKFASLGVSRDDADILTALVVRQEYTRQAYEKAQEDSKA